jgi:hypothetical protein
MLYNNLLYNNNFNLLWNYFYEIVSMKLMVDVNLGIIFVPVTQGCVIHQGKSSIQL